MNLGVSPGVTGQSTGMNCLTGWNFVFTRSMPYKIPFLKFVKIKSVKCEICKN